MNFRNSALETQALVVNDVAEYCIANFHGAKNSAETLMVQSGEVKKYTLAPRLN